MKATIDIDAAVYRRLKVEAARRGSTIRALVAEGLRHVLGLPGPPDVEQHGSDAAEWFGALRKYAAHAGGKHDLAAMRRSIARARRTRP
jgi:hypothetical protein